MEDVTTSGIDSFFTNNIIERSVFHLKSRGVTKEKMEVDVKDLKINLGVISKFYVLETANMAIFDIDGIGKLNAKNLKAHLV